MLATLLSIWPLILFVLGLAASWGVSKYRIDQNSNHIKALLAAFQEHKDYNDKQFQRVDGHCIERERLLSEQFTQIKVEFAMTNAKIDSLMRIVEENNIAVLSNKIDNLTKTVDEIKKWFQSLEKRTHRLETLKGIVEGD